MIILVLLKYSGLCVLGMFEMYILNGGGVVLVKFGRVFSVVGFNSSSDIVNVWVWGSCDSMFLLLCIEVWMVFSWLVGLLRWVVRLYNIVLIMLLLIELWLVCRFIGIIVISGVFGSVLLLFRYL